VIDNNSVNKLQDIISLVGWQLIFLFQITIVFVQLSLTRSDSPALHQVTNQTMPSYNIILLKDELPLSTWLAIGAAAQVLFTLAAPSRYALLPVALTLGFFLLDFTLQYFGLINSPYLKDAERGRHSIMYREADGSRPEGPGTKPVAMFLIGVRSNQYAGYYPPLFWTVMAVTDTPYQSTWPPPPQVSQVQRVPRRVVRRRRCESCDEWV